MDKWNDILAINLSASSTTRLALCRVYGATGGAHHQHCLSAWLVASKRNRPTSPPNAVVGLTVATEAARSGITCNAICWLGANAGAAADRQTHRRGVDRNEASAAAGGKTALRGVCHPAAAGRNGAVSVQRCRRPGARRRMEHGWRLGGAVSRWRRKDQNIARKRFTVRERSKRRQAMAISVFSGAPLSG